MQIQPPQLRFERVNVVVVCDIFAKPPRQARGRWRAEFELNQRVKRQLVFSHDRILETRSFELSSGLCLRRCIRQRADENSEISFFRRGRDDGVHSLLSQGFGDNLGIRARRGDHLPIIASGRFAGDRSSFRPRGSRRRRRRPFLFR
jgi:hypothetical protein